MTKTHKITLILSLIFVILLGLLIKPSFSIVHADDDYTSYNNYTYDSYIVDIVVNEDNSYDITETITMTYGPEIYGVHRGWARAIPYNIPYTAYDSKGTKYKFTANCKVTLTSATEYYRSYKEDGNFVIEMMRPDVYVNNQVKEYVIKYNYAVGNDFMSFKDFFNYNIIGNDFPVDVNNVEFTITMPKAFDASTLKFYYGAYGETAQYTDYSVIGNVISSNAPINLQKNEALTINLDLPEGYYNIPSAKSYRTLQIILPIIGAVSLLILAIVLYMLQNRNTPTQVVEFYAPDNLSPGECKYILDGTVSSLDVSSIIVVWASRGLVKIVLNENKEPKQIARIKDMPDNFSSDEKSIWETLFKSGDVVDTDFNMSVSEKMHTVAKKIQVRYNEDSGLRFTSKSITKVSGLAFLGVIFPIVAIILISKYHTFSSMLWFTITTIAMLVASIVLAQRLINNYVSTNRSKTNKKIIISGLITIACTLPALVTYMSFTPNIIDVSCMFVWYPLVYMAINAFLLGKSLALSKKVFDYYGRVAGFKNSLELVEENQLKVLVKDDPEYFYKVIPYAHVFGIYEKFVNKFKGFAMPINNDIGDTYTTILLLDSMRYSTRRNMIKTYANNAGSSFGSHGGGGGGFSGGGFGGGGGRGL